MEPKSVPYVPVQDPKINELETVLRTLVNAYGWDWKDIIDNKAIINMVNIDHGNITFTAPVKEIRSNSKDQVVIDLDNEPQPKPILPRFTKTK